MASAAGPVRGTLEMVSQMSPQLGEQQWVYTQTTWGVLLPLLPQLQPLLHSVTAEDEGVSVLVQSTAVPTLLPAVANSPALAHIVLRVHSALEGVGLTAAAATALTAEGIACNVVAAYQHDHLFVPVADAERAVGALQRAAADARATLAGDGRT